MVKFPSLTPIEQEKLELSDWLALSFIAEDDYRRA